MENLDILFEKVLKEAEYSGKPANVHKVYYGNIIKVADYLDKSIKELETIERTWDEYNNVPIEGVIKEAQRSLSSVYLDLLDYVEELKESMPVGFKVDFDFDFT